MKIKCKDCVNEIERKCAVTKATVKLNKSRKCNDYEFEASREIARLERKAKAMDNRDRAAMAKQATLAELQAAQVAHPSTGDLSRFKTTAT